MSKHRPTLNELISDLSALTPLGGVFILNAVDAFAHSVLEEPTRPKEWSEHNLIAWDAWYETARSIKACIEHQREQD